MSIIVEDGTGLATAESYISVAAATTYLNAIGNITWAALATDALREQALRRATHFMTGHYRLRWNGTRMTMTQALDWPRSLVPLKDAPFATYYANDTVPTEVKNACASLALRASTITLLADQTQRKSSVTVGPISTTYEAGSKVATTYAEIDAMLRPFLNGGNGQIQLVRT